MTAASHAATSSAVQRIWTLLEQVTDPEIPVVSIRELGILREVCERNGEIDVVITPTYSGCPAMGQIEDDVRGALAGDAVMVNVLTRLAPAWTTDWLTDTAKEKLRAFGIAPPHTASQRVQLAVRFRQRGTGLQAEPVRCPHCGSVDTTETSHFSSTACKALYKCLDCLEPFDYFKPY